MEEKKYHAFGYVKRLLMEISNLIFFTNKITKLIIEWYSQYL